MQDQKNKIAIVVPTKDRPIEIRNLLQSIRNQHRQPDQLIIVDGGIITVDAVVDEFQDLNISYIREYPPSLSRQRNVGMAAVDESICFAGYLDDDLTLDTDAIHAMANFWDTASPHVGGARFNITNEPVPRQTWLKYIFLIDRKQRGRVLKSGFHTSIGSTTKNMKVSWLSGGATIWRKSVINEFEYDEWFQGLGYLEDLDYSYRVSHKYEMVVVSNAKLEHFPTPIRNEISYLYGKWQIINRLYFVNKFPELSKPLCYWAFVGQFIINLGKGLFTLDIRSLKRGFGNIIGIILSATGKLDSTSDIKNS